MATRGVRQTAGQWVVWVVWTAALAASLTLAVVLIAQSRRADGAVRGGEAPGDAASGDAASGDAASGGGEAPVDGEPVGQLVAPAEAVAVQALEADAGGATVAPAGPIVIDGASPLVIDAPGLELTIVDGEVAAVTPGPAAVQFPTTGLLRSAVVEGLTDGMLHGRLGFAPAEELAHLGAHLRPGTSYWYLVLDEGVRIDTGTGFDDALPARFSVPGGGASVVVIDPTDPYVYFGFPCPGSLPGGDEPLPVTVDISTYPAGGCGLGVSGSGRIPFTPTLDDTLPARFADLGAELVIDGEFPIQQVQVTGSAYVDVEATSFALAADGEFSIGVPLRAGELDLSVPVGRASMAYEYDGVSEELWFAGYAGHDVLGDAALQLVVDLGPLDADLYVSGRLRFDATADGVPRLGAESYLEVRGSATVDVGPLALFSDGTPAPMHTAGLVARLDPAGVSVQATAASSPVPGLDLGGDAALSVWVPFDDMSSGHAEISGRFRVAAADLFVDGRLRLDAAGMVLEGRLDTPAGGVEVSGSIGAGGFELTGSAEVVIPVGELAGLAEALAAQAGTDETVRALEAAIDDRIAEIRAVDAARGDRLAAVVRDLRAARAEVEVLRDNIAVNDAKIAALLDELAAADATWQSYDAGEKLLHGPGHGLYVLGLNAEVEALRLANTTQQVLYDGAQLVLTGAESVAMEVAGTDEQLRALQGAVLELRAGAVVSTVVRTVAGGAAAIVSAFAADDELRGSVTFTVGTSGARGAVDASWCRNGECSTLVGGSVELPQFVACADVLGIEACVQL